MDIFKTILVAVVGAFAFATGAALLLPIIGIAATTTALLIAAPCTLR